jgi:hypothetical protein
MAAFRTNLLSVPMGLRQMSHPALARAKVYPKSHWAQSGKLSHSITRSCFMGGEDFTASLDGVLAGCLLTGPIACTMSYPASVRGLSDRSDGNGTAFDTAKV